MRFQQKPYSCGAAAIVNALSALGKRVKESEVRTAAGTTPDGTDEKGILAAVRGFGFVATEHSTNSKAVAWDWLAGNLMHGKAVIIPVATWSHWITCVGLLGNRIGIVDPVNTKSNIRDLGYHSWSRKYLMEQWFYASKIEENEKRLYGISVAKKGK